MKYCCTLHDYWDIIKPSSYLYVGLSKDKTRIISQCVLFTRDDYGNKIKIMDNMAGTYRLHGESRKPQGILVSKLEVQRKRENLNTVGRIIKR
jgi:hypothetical protein